MTTKYEDISVSIVEGLGQFQDCYSTDLYLEFKERLEGLKGKVEQSLQEGRALKIGIVGEVKAGKSSFLNALLFRGHSVLPQASTPMTAALTKISYGETPSAKIEFYNEKDWENIEALAGEYDKLVDEQYNNYLQKQEKNRNSLKPPVIKTKEELLSTFQVPDNLKGCKELVTMFHTSQENLHNYLGTQKEVSIDDVKMGLDNYIGANGSFTPIVKHVELKINEEILQDFEIVDTPGLNDPIVSRCMVTKKFLSECDVVFLLSYTGQFLTQEDIGFMCKTLPSEGVKEIIIVGSKFDSGLLDDNKSKDLRTALAASKYRYDEQARENIKRMIAVSPNKERLYKIQESLPPKYVSSYLYGAALAKKSGKPYSLEQEHMIKRFKTQFSDFVDDAGFLASLSGISDIHKKHLIPLKEEKKRIIDEKNENLLNDNKLKLLSLLGDITEQARSNKESLAHSDKQQLEKKLDTVQKGLNSVRRDVKSVIEGIAIDIEKELLRLKNEMEAEVSNHTDILVSSSTETNLRSYKEGWWIFKKTKYYTETITNHEADVSDVVDNIRQYIVESKRIANLCLDKSVDSHVIEQKLKAIILAGFDMSDTSFDEKEILVPLSLLVKKIKVSNINIDTDSYVEEVAGQFPYGAKNSEIHRLKIAQTKVLGSVCNKLQAEIDESLRKIKVELAYQADTFVDTLNEKLMQNIENIKHQIQNKAESLLRYETLLNQLGDYKLQVKEMEM
ncbi:dynamin family protein [Veillonella sp. CHU732]|uniref:dynamin family protein n=1 Tax=Veillonella sp. CHU732 TaxID=2490949 RepID=UPI000F8C9110|nr:dynamin family protein [Veillonella sp. CHU732]